MIKLEKYIGNKTYMTPDSNLATVATITERYPAWQSFTHVVETDEVGEVLFSFENLSALRTMYAIDKTLTEDAAIAAIETIRNTPPTEPQPTAQDRMAAAMEFQNLMAI